MARLILCAYFNILAKGVEANHVDVGRPIGSLKTENVMSARDRGTSAKYRIAKLKRDYPAYEHQAKKFIKKLSVAEWG